MEIIKATTQSSGFMAIANIYEKVVYYPTVIHEIEVIKLLSSGQIKHNENGFLFQPVKPKDDL